MIYLDITADEFFLKHPELKEQCSKICKEMNIPLKNIKPYITKDTIGIEFDEEGLRTLDILRDESILYH